MKVKELIELLNKMPEDAVVYVWADHGQTNCMASDVYATYDEPATMPAYDFDEDMKFRYDMDTAKSNKVSAISIYSV